MNITRGKLPGAIKTVIYGPEGIGKSTFASQFPGAVFCDTEGSTTHMDVARFDKPEKWADILAAIEWAKAHPDQVGTFVLDTADWAEKLGIRYVCQEEETDKKGTVRGWDSIETPGYGKGYVYLRAAFQKLLDQMNELTEAGVNVVITAHAILKKFEQPDEMGSYDRWSMKLNEKNVAPIVKEWADMVLFANYKTDVVKTSEGKNKARGGQKRIMYTTHNAVWDAKNRFGLEDELPFEFGAIAHLFRQDGQGARPVTTCCAPAAQSGVTVPEEIPEASDARQANPAESTARQVNSAEPSTASAANPAETARENQKPTVTVETAETAPPLASVPEESSLEKRIRAAGKPKGEKAKTATPPARPESMKSEDATKDRMLATVWESMVKAGVPDPNCLQAVVAERGYYEASVLVRDYDPEFIEGCLIEAWDTVRGLCQTAYNNLPF